MMNEQQAETDQIELVDDYAYLKLFGILWAIYWFCHAVAHFACAFRKTENLTILFGGIYLREMMAAVWPATEQVRQVKRKGNQMTLYTGI